MKELSKWDKINQINEIFDWDELEDVKYKGYGKIILKGDCDLYDYERGGYYISIYITDYMIWSKKERKYILPGTYSIRVYYNSIDDAAYGAWLNGLDMKSAEWILEELKKEYNIQIFPSDKEMNKRLGRLGIIIEHEN